MSVSFHDRQRNSGPVNLFRRGRWLSYRKGSPFSGIRKVFGDTLRKAKRCRVPLYRIIVPIWPRIVEKWPYLTKKQVLFHHDNARPSTDAMCKLFELRYEHCDSSFYFHFAAYRSLTQRRPAHIGKLGNCLPRKNFRAGFWLIFFGYFIYLFYFI